MAIYSGLFSLCPRLTKLDGRLVASTPVRGRLLTLGLFYRQVIVDPKEQVVRLHWRHGWLFARDWRIPFQAIQAVTYGYEDWNPFASFQIVRDSVDCFNVGLKLKDREQQHLFYFLGDGTLQNDGPLPDWLYWDEYLKDVSGTQESESQAFVELLRKMIGVPIDSG
jgi:hypothetical protein